MTTRDSIKKFFGRLLFATVMLAIGLAGATGAVADDMKRFEIAEAMNNPEYEQKLDRGVQFYWGDQAHPEIVQNHGEYVTNKKTNAVNKNDREACEWVLLSALLQLRDRALAEGGNAVVNIRSYYKKREFSSETEYECAPGFLMAGVALKGTVVELAE